jgi:hypothetical protein
VTEKPEQPCDDGHCHCLGEATTTALFAALLSALLAASLAAVLARRHPVERPVAFTTLTGDDVTHTRLR